MTNRVKDNGEGRAKSRTVPRQSLADNHFQELARKRVLADLEQLTGKKVTSLRFQVEVPFEMRMKAVMEMPLPQVVGRRSISGETARVIKAESLRRLTKHGSMQQMSERFFTDLSKSERYDHYRAVVAHHAGKIKEFLSILKKYLTP